MPAATDTPPKFDLTHAASATAIPDVSCFAYAMPRIAYVNVAFGASGVVPEQAWFWSTAWQAGEHEASADLQAGRVAQFDTGDDFLAALRAIADE
jgi:hypothetical protein